MRPRSSTSCPTCLVMSWGQGIRWNEPMAVLAVGAFNAEPRGGGDLLNDTSFPRVAHLPGAVGWTSLCLPPGTVQCVGGEQG